MDTQLFVYGTLRRGSPHPMRAVLERQTVWEGPARMAGLLYDAGTYPGLVPDPLKRNWVVGDLYRVREPDTLFPMLDEYEGCGAEETHPEYRRVRRLAHAGRRAPCPAWVYVYDRPVTGLARVTSGDYWKHTRPAREGAPLDR